MSFFDKVFNGTKKYFSIVDYYDYDEGASFSEFTISDIDGWLVCLKSGQQYCAPFSINIPDNWKRDENIFSDEKLKEYIDATITKYIDDMSYYTNNMKDEDYQLCVIGCYSYFGIKLFKPIKLGIITFKGKLNVSKKNENEGGVKNDEEKKEKVN